MSRALKLEICVQMKQLYELAIAYLIWRPLLPQGAIFDWKAKFMPSSLPPYDPKRQADAVIRAYQYQFLETAIAWLELGPSDTLLVEVAEDYDVQSGDGETTLTQVTHASTGRRLTLASEKSRDALANFWMASSGGADPSISMVLHTNMAPGREVGCAFPDGQSGIEYWGQVQVGADPLPLRDALTVLLKSGPLLDWLKTGPDGDDIAAKLVNRVTWRMEQEVGPERTAMLTALIMSRLPALGLPSGFASNAASLVVYRVLETASNPEVNLRRLTARDLNRFLHEVVRPGQPGHETQWGLASWTAPLDTLPLPRICAPREPLVGSLASQLAETGAVWFHGASGASKSTLAQQTASRVRGAWLLIDFRNQDEPTEILLRVERAYTDVTLTEQAAGVILDDLKPDLVSHNARRFAMFVDWLRKRNRHVIMTSAQAPSPALAAQLGLQQASIIAAPYLEQADVEEMVRLASAPLGMIQAWAFFIHSAAAQGHPQLSAAKVASLAYRSWPEAALTEDFIGRTSEAVELTRTEARQRLLREATEGGRALLKRLACIFLRFDRSMAIAAASVDPAISDPSASLDFLTGPWIEPAPGLGRYFRLSPLLYGLNEDLSPVTKKAVQASIAINAVRSGPISSESLDIVFWNAIFAEQGWFFVQYFKASLSFDEEKSAALASKLSTIVFLSTDRPIIPGDLGGSFIIRLIQLDVAAINRNERLFQAIAEAVLREAELQDAEEAKQAMRFMALSKILFAQGGRLDWATRLAWIGEYEALTKKDPFLTEQADSPVIQGLMAEFGDDADLPGFLLAIGFQTIQTPDDLQSLFTALGGLTEYTRRRWLAQSRAISKGDDLYVQAAWANAWSGGKLEADKAITAYEAMESQARAWSDIHLAHQCIVAQSVLWDEFKNDATRAITVIDHALNDRPEDPALLRQKAKVLGHEGNYESARAILTTLKPKLNQHSSVEQLYILKEEAVAAARLGDLADARSLFLQAASVGDEETDSIFNVRCHKIALRAEAALCAWWMEDQSQALTELAAVLDETAAVNPETSDAARMLHVKMRWLVGWIDLVTRAPQGGLPPELVAGAMSAQDAEVTDEHRIDRGSFDGIKLILLVSAYRCGVTDLAMEIDWSATTPACNLMLVGAEFDLAIESRRPDLIATAILNVAAGFLILSDDASDSTVARTPFPIKDGGGITLADRSSELVRPVLCQLIGVAAFRLRRDVSSIRDIVHQILAELEGRLGGDETLFAELRTALDGGKAEPVSVAGQLVLGLLAKEARPLLPRELIQYHLNLIACSGFSGAGARTARAALSAMSDDWTYVIDRQRFLLARPALTAPQLQGAIEQVRSHRPGALSELLDMAAKGLNMEIPASWRRFCEHLGGAA
jgi:hypothetical protein